MPSVSDEVWARNDLVPDRKLKMTVGQFKVRQKNGWRLTDPPPPPNPEDDKKLQKAVDKTAKSKADKKPSPAKKPTITVEKKPSPAKKSTPKVQKKPSKSSTAKK